MYGLIALTVLSDSEFGYHVYLKTVNGECSYNTDCENIKDVLDEVVTVCLNLRNGKGVGV